MFPNIQIIRIISIVGEIFILALSKVLMNVTILLISVFAISIPYGNMELHIFTYLLIGNLLIIKMVRIHLVVVLLENIIILLSYIIVQPLTAVININIGVIISH